MTNNPIDSLIPIQLTLGGTNNASYTSHGTIYYDGTKLSSTSTGASGTVLVSNGPSLAPTYQSGAGSSATICGLTGNQLVGTGGGTGSVKIALPFAGTVSRLYVNVWPTSNNTLSVTMTITGTSISITIPPATPGVYSDLVHTASFPLGSLITLTSSSPGPATHYIDGSISFVVSS